jgi:hypothetical protein
VTQAEHTVLALELLGGELQRLLEVVVLDRHGLVEASGREQDLEALLALLSELRTKALASMRGELKRLLTQLKAALPRLLAFVAPLEPVQQEMTALLGREGVALVAWAWQRRAILAPAGTDLVAGLPASWRGAARVLLHAWERAVRASSAVENWHSILRPHLAVHRTLSAGMLALLAVWHNHRVFTRGVHQGFSPLQLSGMLDAPTDWLVALGYPSADRVGEVTPPQRDPSSVALAA